MKHTIGRHLHFWARWYAERRPNAGVGLLLMVIGALAALNWWLLAMTIDTSPIDINRGAGSIESVINAAAVAPFDPKPLASFSETGARPLFSHTRRPRVVAPQAALHVPLNVHLVGVVMIAPTDRRALLRSAHEPRGQWIAEGGKIGEWTLLIVGASEVVIDGRGGRHELKLPRSGTNRRAKP